MYKNNQEYRKYIFGKNVFVVCMTIVFTFMIVMPSAESGIYIGIGLVRVDIGGDMDGTTFVSGGGSAEVLPEQETAVGNKWILGYSGLKWDGEISLTNSDHDGVWGGLQFDSEFQSINLDMKRRFRVDQLAQPMFIIGFGFTELNVKDGSTDGNVVADAKFEGIDLRFGGGVELALHKHFAIDLQYVYRWGSYDSVDGIVSGSVDELDLDGNGASISAEAKIKF